MSRSLLCLSLTDSRARADELSVDRPELEERNGKQLLIFHPFIIERVIDIAVEVRLPPSHLLPPPVLLLLLPSPTNVPYLPPLAQPLPVSSIPPTEEEATFLRDARVVPSLEEAERATSAAPKHGEGEWAQEKGRRGGEVERALEEATGVAAAERESEEKEQRQGEGGEKDGEEKQVQKKGWWGFGWGK